MNLYESLKDLKPYKGSDPLAKLVCYKIDSALFFQAYKLTRDERILKLWTSYK